MTLKDLEKGDGYELDEIEYESADDLIQKGMLGFCDCGAPDLNLKYILGGLELIAAGSPELPHGEWWSWFHKRMMEVFGGSSAGRFFFYWCDKEDLTEHGSGLTGGGWLTGKGQDLLDVLREWKAMPEEES